MPVVINSATDLFVFWQGQIIQSGSETKAPCPFCDPKSRDGAVIFSGRDRLHFYHDMKGAYCRVCDADGRGDIGAKPGYWRTATIARRFGVQLAGDFDTSTPEPQEQPLADLWTEGDVAAAHQKVDYDFWFREYAWPKSLVDKFQLGMGNLYPNRWTEDWHLIPMKGLIRYGEEQIRHHYIAARFREVSGLKRKERGRGSSKAYIWLIEADTSNREIALVEGDTDGITADLLGFTNIAATFGSRTWTFEKAKLLKERGYERVIVLADGDIPGQTLANQQIETCLRAGFTDIWVLRWPENDNRDISQLYKDLLNSEDAYGWINQHLDAPTERIQRRVNPYLDQQGPRELLSLDTLRGDGPQGMRQQIQTFLGAYDLLYKRGQGRALHLQAPPGAGKTHLLIETAEDIAHKSLEAKEKERQELIRTIQDYESLGILAPQDTLNVLYKKLANWSVTAIAWYGLFKLSWEDLRATGAHEELWYNFEARNENNCQNLTRVQELGEKHHDIGHFCMTACPFFQQCSEEGYWRQEKERHSKPITFFRHPHLKANHDLDYKALIVVDEYAGHVLENEPVRFESKHIYPSYEGWELDILSLDIVKAIQDFAEALRATLSSNSGAPATSPDYTLSGAAFIRKFNEHARSVSGRSLESLLDSLDRKSLHQIYQPHFAGAATDIVHLRCLPQFYDVLMREFLDYLEDPDNKYPSCLHLVAGTMEVYAPGKVHNRQKTPMIISDATGIAGVYSAMFGRRIESYSPIIRNPNAVVEVLRGSDFTKSAINTQLGPAMRDRKRLQSTQPIVSLEGQMFDPEDVPISEEYYDSQILREALAISQELAKRHRSLLIVTHKDLRELMKSLIEVGWENDERAELKDHIAFGHYGSLRGTNKYKDYEAVALIGVFRIPYNVVWRRVQMWAWMLGIKEEIKADLIKQDDGLGGTYPSFSHQFADAFVEMLEVGELEQVAARIRPHSSDDKKYIYYFGNRPAMAFVNKISSKTDFLRGRAGTRHEPLYQFLLGILQSNNPVPSYSIIRDKFHVGNATISKTVNQIKMELNLK